MSNEGLAVVCPWCRGHFFDTTKEYKTSIPSHGGMFTPVGDCKENNWSHFPCHDGMKQGDLECPGCGGVLWKKDGIVEVKGAKPDKVPCPYCEGFFHPRGLEDHILHKHPEQLENAE